MPGRLACVNAAIDQNKPVAVHDAIQRCHGLPRMKTAAARRKFEMARKIGKAAARRAPFVEISCRYCRHVWSVKMGVQNCRGLSPAPEAGKVQVHAEQPKRRFAEPHLGYNRATRFKAWQVNDVARLDLHGFADEYRVSMPANAV